MPLPLLHAAAGYAVYHATKKETHDWKMAAACIALANAADLDFIPGILVGNPNLFHHSCTHSFTAAAAIGLAAAAWSWLSKKNEVLRNSLIAFFAYASHVALDFLFDHPTVMPLFWPVTPGRLMARLQAFDLQKIHLEAFDNFLCDRFLSLSCLKRFTSEVIIASMGAACFLLLRGELKQKPARLPALSSVSAD